MTKSFSDLLAQLANHAASLNDNLLAHILRMAVLEATKSGAPAPQALIGVWDWDLTNDLAYLDPACAQMFGVKPRKGVPSSIWMKAIHPDDASRVSEEIRKMLKTGGEYQLEYRLIVNDSARWISAKGYCTLDSSNRPERFPGAILELPDRSASRRHLN
jgi:PAS domain-containing protein